MWPDTPRRGVARWDPVHVAHRFNSVRLYMYAKYQDVGPRVCLTTSTIFAFSFVARHKHMKGCGHMEVQKKKGLKEERIERRKD